MSASYFQILKQQKSMWVVCVHIGRERKYSKNQQLLNRRQYTSIHAGISVSQYIWKFS